MISSSIKRNPDLIAIFALLTGLLVFKSWIVGVDNVFVMDDYSNLLRDSHQKILNNLKLLPKALYNDRPVGDIFYYLVNTQFGLNHVIAHVLQLLLHGFNVLAVYYIFRKLLLSPAPAFFGALVFGVNPMSTMCVHWTSAIYDLFAMTFAVGSMAILVYHLGDRNRLPYFTPLMLLLGYILSVRSKEATIFLPFMWILVLAIYRLRHNLPWRGFLSEARVLIPSLLFFCAIFCTYVMLKAAATAPLTVDPKSIYYQTFSPLAMAGKLYQYLVLYFGISQAVFAVVALFCIVFCRKLDLLFHVALIGLSFLIILPMVNNTHQLYLYVPSFSVVLLMACSLDYFFRKFPNGKLRIAGMVVLVALSAFHFQGLDKLHFNHVPWLGIAKKQHAQASQLKANLTHMAGNEKILVYNLPPKAGTNIFTFYGPGNSIRLYTGKPNIQCVIDPNPTVSPEEKAKYHVLINFNDGKLIFEKLPQGAPRVNYRGLF